jgi:hypothetical protein
MTTLNKNHSARLKRVQQRLDRSLDSIMQANGELWPANLRPYGERLQQAVDILQKLSRDIDGHLSGATVVDDEQETTVDPNQEDIEDVEGVEQPQPEAEQPAGRRRRAS